MIIAKKLNQKLTITNNSAQPKNIKVENNYGPEGFIVFGEINKHGARYPAQALDSVSR